MMKRALAIAAVLTVLAPMAPLVASLCETMPCCSGGDDRVSAPMGCCLPAMCAAPPGGRQAKAVDNVSAPTGAEIPEVTSEVVQPPQHLPLLEAPPASAPLRVRLALIATLLI